MVEELEEAWVVGEVEAVVPEECYSQGEVVRLHQTVVNQDREEAQIVARYVTKTLILT